MYQAVGDIYKNMIAVGEAVTKQGLEMGKKKHNGADLPRRRKMFFLPFVGSFPFQNEGQRDRSLTNQMRTNNCRTVRHSILVLRGKPDPLLVLVDSFPWLHFLTTIFVEYLYSTLVNNLGKIGDDQRLSKKLYPSMPYRLQHV